MSPVSVLVCLEILLGKCNTKEVCGTFNNVFLFLSAVFGLVVFVV